MILHTLFPDVRAEVIRCLFGDPRREIHVRALARLTTLALRTVQKELARLSKTHFVLSRSNGYQRFYRANQRHPAFAPLQQLVRKGSTPIAVCKSAQTPTPESAADG